MATAAISANEVLARLAAVWPRETLSSPRVGLVTAHPEMLHKSYIFGLPSMPGWRRPPWLPAPLRVGPRFGPRCRCLPCDRLNFLPATGRDCSLSTTSLNRRGLPSMPPAELGINGPKSWGRDWYRKVRETRSSGSHQGHQASRQDRRDPAARASSGVTMSACPGSST